MLIFYFAKLIFAKVKIHTLFGRIGSGRAIILFASGNNLCILNTLYSITSIRNLLNFKDIHRSNYHIDIFSERNIEFICLIINISSKKYVIKKDIGFTLQVLFYNHKNNWIKSSIIQKCAYCDMIARSYRSYNIYELQWFVKSLINLMEIH